LTGAVIIYEEGRESPSITASSKEKSKFGEEEPEPQEAQGKT